MSYPPGKKLIKMISKLFKKYSSEKNLKLLQRVMSVFVDCGALSFALFYWFLNSYPLELKIEVIRLKSDTTPEVTQTEVKAERMLLDNVKSGMMLITHPTQPKPPLIMLVLTTNYIFALQEINRYSLSTTNRLTEHCISIFP
ncbi:hypothetical protein CEXT_6541 [Caerostris extrusa]|uniref:Uncharacterized protein n=1 Tax=Caerostris extrusa TaxID=172846 RepID=A0AAV4PBG0_CAEEX|nr:hypothetical protein CEXT_6541 [Caerostris extrusa]